MVNEIIQWFGSLGITSIVIALIENKYHIVNRIRKRMAILKNSGTDASFSLEYKINKSFEVVVDKFKEKLRGKGFGVDKITNTKAKFRYGSISFEIILNAQGNLFIEVDKIGCGIRDLKNKINEFLGKIREIEKDGLFSDFICCDLSFTLPYKWDNFNIWIPKGLELKKYSVGFSDKTYKSEIDLKLNKVNIKSDTLHSINYLVEKFV
jgi:hypothetical protein